MIPQHYKKSTIDYEKNVKKFPQIVNHDRTSIKTAGIYNLNGKSVGSKRIAAGMPSSFVSNSTARN